MVKLSAKQKKSVKKKPGVKKTGAQNAEKKVGLIRTFLNFLNEPINLFGDHEKERVEFLDTGRGFGLFAVILHHTYLLTATVKFNNESLFAYIIDSILWVPGTRNFFFVFIGMYVIYVQPSAKKMLTRGLQLFALGYVLNILRFLPVIIGVTQGSLDMENFYPYHTLGDLVFQVDIFHFAGLSFLTLALLRKVMGPVVKPLYWVLLALAVLFVTPFLVDRLTGFIYIDRFLNLLWGTGPYVWFPFFPYFSFVLLGGMFGSAMITIKDLKNMHGKLLFIGLSLFLAGYFVLNFWGEPFRYLYIVFFERDFFISPGYFIRSVGYLMFIAGIFSWLQKIASGNIIVRLFNYWSKNIVVFFFFHWIIIGWITGIYFQSFRQEDSLVELSALFLITVVLTHVITRLISGPVPVLHGTEKPKSGTG